MKKIFRLLLATLVMVLGVSTVSFAEELTAAQKLQQQLRSLGVSDAYIGSAIEYLQKVDITDAQASSVMAKIDEAAAIIGDTKDIRTLSSEQKSTIQKIASEAGAIVGLNVKFGKDEKGVTTVVLTDSAGKTVLALATTDVLDKVKNFDISLIKNVFEAVVEFAQNPNKGKFDPISGSLNNTGTNSGTVIAFGTALVLLSTVVFVGSKKVFA